MAGKEKNYAAIAKTKITKPSVSKRRRKILVYGRNKKGKTTFANSAPKTLILDPEHGTDALVESDPDVWPIESWEDVDDAYNFLRLGKHNYEWVAVDGLTRINNMCLRFIMRMQEDRDLSRRPGIVDRRDYNKSGELMKAMLGRFHNLPLGVVYTAQERSWSAESTDEESDEETMTYVPDLPQGVRSTVNSLVDVIGRIYVARVKVKRDGKIVEVNQRRLWIYPSERYDTGYRSEFELPQFVRNPTVPKLVELTLKGEVDGR